jgi:hypothetical protein
VADSDLLGRRTESSRLSRLLDSTASAGGALALVGQPGVGKSALLRWAAQQAAARGMQVLSVTGVEDEFEIPYAALHLLAEGLPRGRRNELAQAITHDWGPSRVAQILLNVLSELGLIRPVVLCVDDSHWLDPQSWEVLTFLARRLADDPVLLLLGIRESGQAEDRLDGSGLATMSVQPLATAEAEELLDRHRSGLSPDRREQVLAQAAGNPLGLIELASEVAVEPGSPLPLPERLERAFAQAVRGLSATTRTLVQVAALDESQDAPEILEAARRLDPHVSADDFVAAVTAKILVRADTPVEFRHPLIRSGVRQALRASRRRQIHAALAAVLDTAPRRQLWHRVAAAVGADDDLAAELSRLGDALHARESAALAVNAYEAAARLTSDPRTRTAVLWQAFDALNDVGGQNVSRRLLGDLATQSLSAGDRAMVAYFTYLAGGGGGSAAEKAAHLIDTVESFISDGLDLTALEALRHFSIDVFWSNPDRATRQRVVDTIARMPFSATEPVLCAALGLWAPLEQGAIAADALVRYAAGPDDAPTLHAMSMAALSVGALPLGLRLLERAVALYHRLGCLGVLGDDLALQAMALAALGRATLSGAAASQGRSLNSELQQPRELMIADMARGHAAALRGDHVEAQTIADELERILIPAAAYPLLAHVQLIRGTAALAEGPGVRRAGSGFRPDGSAVSPLDPVLGPVVAGRGGGGVPSWGGAADPGRRALAAQRTSQRSADPRSRLCASRAGRHRAGVSGSTRRERAAGLAVRDGSAAARVRKMATTPPASDRGSRAVACRGRHVHRVGRDAVGEALRGRVAGHRRTPGARRRCPAAANPAGVPDRAADRRGTDEPRDRRPAVPLAANGGQPSAAHLPQGGRLLPHRAGASVRRPLT